MAAHTQNPGWRDQGQAAGKVVSAALHCLRHFGDCPRHWWEAASGRRLGAWDSRQVAGRTASMLVGTSGLAGLFSVVRPDAPGEDPIAVLAVGVVAAVLGIVLWFMPWKRWPGQVGLLLIPAGFLLIAFRNYVGGNDPFLVPIFFVAAYTWIGLTQPRGTALLSMPIFAAAYLGPIHQSGVFSDDAMGSVGYTAVVCLLVGETIAWVVSRLHRAQSVIRERQIEARFKALVQNASDVVAVLEVDGTVKYVTPSVERVFGVGSESLVGTNLTGLVHSHDVPLVETFLAELATRGDPIRPGEWRFVSGSGGTIVAETIGTNLLQDPDVHGVVLTVRDVSERTALQQQITRQAFHDSLTDLPNRALFLDRLEHAVARSERDEMDVVVLFMDLDDFKDVNDSLGHAAGDELLIKVAERLRSVLRSEDTAARLGGDEFAVLLEGGSGVAHATQIAERIEQSLAEPFAVGAAQVFISASIGIAVRCGVIEGAEELLRNADLALYAAKADGKRRHMVYEPSMHEAVRDRLELEAQLRRALDRGELRVHYQPIIRTEDGRPVGVEALARWEHPTRGLLLPEEFIPLAEDTGLIVPLGLFVLKTACARVGEWRRAGVDPELTLSVNLSPRQLRVPEDVQDLIDVVTATGCDPSKLVFEITENVLLSETPETLSALALFREHGIRIAIDDFGTGYSSLAYLRRYPVDILKMPQVLVEGVDGDLEGSALARTVLSLGGLLNLEVVAEGIECREQLERLTELECDMWQGFLDSHPEEATSVAARLLEEQRAAAPSGAGSG